MDFLFTVPVAPRGVSLHDLLCTEKKHPSSWMVPRRLVRAATLQFHLTFGSAIRGRGERCDPGHRGSASQGYDAADLGVFDIVRKTGGIAVAPGTAMGPAYPPTGIAEIDAEHRAIAELVSLLEQAAAASDRDTAVRLVGTLESAVAAHFVTEERLMSGVAYPDAERHRDAHSRYLAGLRNQAETLRAGALTPAVVRWLNNLDAWFRMHVVEEDVWLAIALVDAQRLRP